VRAYRVGDGTLIAGLGVAACCVAVAILALYPVIEPGHGQRWALWPVSALLLFWMSYMWLMAHRGNISGDPVSFALHSRVSRIFAVLTLAALALIA
jgi:predicted Abi (CAAX) family protease